MKAVGARLLAESSTGLDLLSPARNARSPLSTGGPGKGADGPIHARLGGFFSPATPWGSGWSRRDTLPTRGSRRTQRSFGPHRGRRPTPRGPGLRPVHLPCPVSSSFGTGEVTFHDSECTRELGGQVGVGRVAERDPASGGVVGWTTRPFFRAGG